APRRRDDSGKHGPLTMNWGVPGGLIAGVSRTALVAALLCTPTLAHADQTLSGEAIPADRSARSVTMSIPLLWNAQVLGDVIVQVDPDGSAVVESQSLRAELSALLTDAGILRLDEVIAGDPFVTPEVLQAAGFEINLDMARLELVVSAIDPTLRPVEPLGGRTQNSERLLP